MIEPCPYQAYQGEIVHRDIATLDPRAMAGDANPYPVLAGFREHCPVSRSETYGGFLNLFRYRDICDVTSDAGRFSNRDNTVPSQNLPIAVPPINLDPPVHIQFRQPFVKHFGPPEVAKLEPAMRAKLTELIDGFIERGSVDLARELFIPYPAYAVLRLLNLPEEDFDLFTRWAFLIFTAPQPGEPEGDWAGELEQYFAPLHAQLTGTTGNSIPALARNLRVDGKEIEVIEFVMLMMSFLTAGLDTTANAAAQFTLLFDQHPDMRHRLIENPGMIPLAVEELLRFTTPLPTLARIANEDTTFGAELLRAGEKVALHYLAANHDPDEFVNPEQLILDRKPNRHLAFGRGPHRCIGMHLARLELTILLEELLPRIPDFRVDHARVVRTGGVTRQVPNLPVSFTPGPRKGIR